MTYRNHRAVNERYTHILAEGMELHEQHHLEEYTGHKFYKTIIGDGSRELIPEPPTDTLQIKYSLKLPCKTILKIQLIENKEVTFLIRLNR